MEVFGAKNGAGEGVNSGFCSDVISKELCLGAARGGEQCWPSHTHTRTHTHVHGETIAHASVTVREADVKTRWSRIQECKRPDTP